jgi:hypothetical protein
VHRKRQKTQTKNRPYGVSKILKLAPTQYGRSLLPGEFNNRQLALLDNDFSVASRLAGLMHGFCGQPDQQASGMKLDTVGPYSSLQSRLQPVSVSTCLKNGGVKRVPGWTFHTPAPSPACDRCSAPRCADGWIAVRNRVLLDVHRRAGREPINRPEPVDVAKRYVDAPSLSPEFLISPFARGR